MGDNLLPFKISTGLKNIIGRDLITDDYVAVFELVKNSFDAHATEVIITFREGKIIIADDGKGMDLNDINNKWLFVAYSAKKEGVEDDDLKEKEFDSYRDKIQAKKYYAGAKGIGRFSCDRLGSKLTLTTKKASVNSIIHQIEVDWNEFDKDSEQEFLEIKVKHRTPLPVTRELKKLQRGTILEISNLNSDWNREKKQGLKHSLEKLINPFGTTNSTSFKIYIEDEEERDADRTENNKRDKINGEIKNFVFETLNLKTTQIETQIDEDGKFITTSLSDRGTLVYKVKRPNNTNPKLSNIKFHLFFLNRAAKNNFTREMGIQPVYFGSIFLYKNGFRIAPYGDYGVDYFGIDSRHTQAIFRTLGLRDLIGRIEIVGDNLNFKEISSRDGGLVKNEYYQSLLRCFERYCLSKLENYVTRVNWKAKEDKDLEDTSALQNAKSKSELLDIIADEISEEDVQLEDLDKSYVSLKAKELLAEASNKELENLKAIASKFSDRQFSKDAISTEKEFEKIKIEKEELERKLKEEESVRKKIEEELEAERKESLFHKKLVGTDIKEVANLQHHIDRATDKINDNVDKLIEGISNDISKISLLKFVDKISLESKKISSIAQFVTNANFNVKAKRINKDLNRFIKEYIENVHQEYEHLKLNRQLLHVELKSDGEPFILSFVPIEVIIVIDNLFSNSYRAKAKNVQVTLKKKSAKTLEFIFQDDGKGIPDTVLPRIFNLGFTTTEGSGIGLYHVNQIVEKMKADISVNNKITKGVIFKINFHQHDS